MKLKYYLRGLGIGIVVTALLMGVTMKDNGAMTDEQIKARAMELGMVEQRTLADIRDNLSEPIAEPVVEATEAPVATEEPQAEVTEAPGTEPTQEPESTEAPVTEPTREPAATEAPGTEPTQEPESTEAPGAESTQEPVTTENPQQSQPEPGTVVTIEIERGESSEAVSRRLADEGLIEDADEFNRYLRKNKLTKVIYVGTFEIEMGADMEEIARIITN